MGVITGSVDWQHLLSGECLWADAASVRGDWGALEDAAVPARGVAKPSSGAALCEAPSLTERRAMRCGSGSGSGGGAGRSGLAVADKAGVSAYQDAGTLPFAAPSWPPSGPDDKGVAAAPGSLPAGDGSSGAAAEPLFWASSGGPPSNGPAGCDAATVLAAASGLTGES